MTLLNNPVQIDPERIRTCLRACHERVPEFSRTYYSVRGALRLYSTAWGVDVLIAPINFLMMFPNFLIWLAAFLLEQLRARRAAHWLYRVHIGLPTRVERHLRAAMTDELLTPRHDAGPVADALLGHIHAAARDPVNAYLRTRHVAGDITAGLLALVAGLVFFSQATPGSVSAGSALAQVVAHEQAVAGFLFGEYFGRMWYGWFPVEPSTTIIAASIAAVMLTLAVVSAFAGVLHDPVQRLTGLHDRRLHQLLDAIEQAAIEADAAGYNPKDALAGRTFDLIDWLKALF